MKVTKFEIVDHGLEHPDYFQGCGVAFTQFEEVYTGHGQTPYEAANEALDILCHDNDVSNAMLKEIERAIAPVDLLEVAEIPEDSEAVYMVSIRIK
jgi:hypothetical protein